MHMSVHKYVRTHVRTHVSAHVCTRARIHVGTASQESALTLPLLSFTAADGIVMAFYLRKCVCARIFMCVRDLVGAHLYLYLQAHSLYIYGLYLQVHGIYRCAFF